MPESTVVSLKIGEIIIKDRTRKNFDSTYIDDLAESIAEKGQLQPILVDSEGVLIAGECRIKALLLRNKAHVDAIIIPIEQIVDRKALEWDENNRRKDFTISEKIDIAIAIEKKLKEAGERRGRKSKDIKNKEDTNVGNSPQLGEKSRNFIAKQAGLTPDIYRMAREVSEKAIQTVIEAMDKSKISVNAAFDIARQPQKRQPTLLLTALGRNSVETTEPASKPRKANRKAKEETTRTHSPSPIFNIIHIAPDYSNTISDILETPVNDYASHEFAVVTIACDSISLPLAIQCLERWNFTYKTTLTVWNPNGTHCADTPEYQIQPVCHIVIGDRCDPENVDMFFPEKITRLQPVIAHNSEPLNGSVISIIDKMFPSTADKRISMSSSEKCKGWARFESFANGGNGVESENEEEPVECDKSDVPLNVLNGLEDIASIEAPPKRVLKIFE